MTLILLDVDGVVADFKGHFFRKLGLPEEYAQSTVWDIFEIIQEPFQSRGYELLKDPDWWVTIPVVEGAKEGVAQLKAMGAEIVWVTAPWVSCEKWEHARKKWLSKHFSAKPVDVLPVSRKELIFGDVFIDDKIEHIEQWKAHHPDGLGLLYTRPYNQHSPLPRITWADLLESGLPAR